MKKICLIGPVDKRAISYPLIKCLMFLGKTLVVTDDGVYRRFDVDYNSEFEFGHSKFIVTPVIDEGVQERVKDLEVHYDYILYITTNELPDGMDKIIYARGVEKSIASKDVLDVLEKLEFTEVYVTLNKLKDPEIIKISPDSKIMSYLMECEDKKEFLDTKDTAYANMLHNFFEKELGLSKTAIKGLMLRKG